MNTTDDAGFLDRTNIGNARLANLEKDLRMTGLDYNVWTRNYLVRLLTPHRSLWQSCTHSMSQQKYHPTL